METLLSPEFVPFSIALGLLFGLMALELVIALMGGTLLGMGDGDADFDLDMDVDAGLEGLESLDGIDFDGAELEFELGELGEAPDMAPDVAAAEGPGDFLGISKAPTMIWVAALLLGFGLTGVVLQSVLQNLTGTAFPALMASAIAGIAGLGFAKRFARVFARLIPKSESSALSERSLGRRKGIVSQGTAARGKPAEVRVTDGYGNTHYLRAEPLRDEVEITQGSEVLVMRQAHSGDYRLIALSDL